MFSDSIKNSSSSGFQISIFTQNLVFTPSLSFRPIFTEWRAFNGLLTFKIPYYRQLGINQEIITKSDSRKIYVLVNIYRGTGMIASSSTFCPHLGRVIRDLFRLLDAVYGIVREH